MKRSLFALTLTVACLGAYAQAQPQPQPQLQPIVIGPAPVASAKAAATLAHCDSCGTVQDVKEETRKGKGGAAGIVGGAVVGGLLGHQVGGGTGKDLATVGGAVGGAVIGNEIQKRANSKKVWVTSVRMKDGSVHNFEQDAKPVWVPGNVVQVKDKTLTLR